MLAKHLLAIDGGGSKTQFLVTTTAGDVVQDIVVRKGSNPWRTDGGVQSALATIQEGLTQVNHPEHIIACAAGISGCHGDSKFVKDFHALLVGQLPNASVKVYGDLITAFRAISPEPHGQLALAGSGSAIAHFYPEGETYSYDAVGYGGRDIAVSIITALQHNGPGDRTPGMKNWDSAVREWTESLLHTDLDDISTFPTMYHHPHILETTKAIAELPPDDPKLIALHPLLHHIADRWAYKLWGSTQKYRTKLQLTDDTPVTTVLGGSVWQFALIREQVVQLLTASDPHIIIRHNTDRPPIYGALSLAQDIASHKA